MTQPLALNKKITAPLLAWYRANRRELPWRRDTDAYHVWISEIMLQQTRVETAIPYYERFLAALPSIAALAAVDDEKLLKLWEGLGYYSRAKNLKKAARQIVEQHDGRFPQDIGEIGKLPGIGPYTTGAIASISYGQRTPAVDGNVLRVSARLLNYGGDVTANIYKKQITAALVDIYPKTDAGAFTQALMELGALVCMPGAPRCSLCPLTELCMAYKAETAAALPVLPKKKPRAIEQLTVFGFICNNKLALCRRDESGLLAGLWQLPNLPGKLTRQNALEAAAQWQLGELRYISTARHTHVFTHREWHMTCYIVECESQSREFEWASRRELEAGYALPSAFRRFVDTMDQYL